MVFSVALGARSSTLWKIQQRLSQACDDDELYQYENEYYEDDEHFDFSTIASTTSFFEDDLPSDMNDINSFHDSAANDSWGEGRFPPSTSRHNEKRKQIQPHVNSLAGESAIVSLQRNKQRTTRNWMSPSFYFCGYSIDEEAPTDIILQKPLKVSYKQRLEEEERVPPPGGDRYAIPHGPSQCSQSKSFCSQQADQTTVSTTSVITQITTPSMIARANHICEDTDSEEECSTEIMKPRIRLQASVDRRTTTTQASLSYFDIHNIPNAPSQCESIESFNAAWLPSPPSVVTGIKEPPGIKE